MGAFSLLFVLLTSFVSTTVAQIPFPHSRQPVLSVEVLPLPTSVAPEPTTVLTVDCLFCSVTDGEDVPSVTEWDPSVITITEKLTVITDEFTREYSTTYGKASETIICAPPCQTLVTVPCYSMADNDIVHHDMEYSYPFGRDVDFSIPVNLDIMFDYFHAYVSLDMGAAWFLGLERAGFERTWFSPFEFS
ncbi:hypothetical protein ACHAP8_005057 [Fusarium lateritium]